MKKIYDLSVKVDEYTDGAGQKKAKWQNVGTVMEGEEGKRFILLDRTFNPAGVPNEGNRPNVLISMFEPKQNGSGNPPF